jgi:transposase
MKRMDANSQAQLRLRVVGAVLAGMSQSKASEVFGVGLRSVNRWMARASTGGLEAVARKPRGRRTGEAGKLTASQAARVKKLIVGRMPEQLKLPFYLWTREAVRWLIKREYGVKLSLSSIGNYLKGWGMRPQKPVRRAYERDDSQIARWLEEQYPRIAREARRDRAVIYWGDESGFRSDDVRGRSYGLRGRTPEVRATGARFSCNMISALTNRGALAFRVFSGRFVTVVFIDFLERLLKHAGRRNVVLIVDGHPVHKAKVVRAWLKEHAHRIRMFLLPGYAPELNPDELLNHDVKQAVGKTRPRDRDDLKSAVRSWLHRRQKQPEVVRNFFAAEHVRYAA